MKKIKIICALLLSFLTLSFGNSQTTKAADNPSDYSVTPVMPANQRKDVSGYFDLIMTKNQKQDLAIQINNGAKTETTFEVYLNPAMTSDGGAIDYGIRNAKVDKSVPFDIRDVAKLDKHSYTVPANSSINVPIHLQMTSQAWQGRVLGGINIQKTGKGAQTGTSENASMRTKIAYSVALVLQQKLEKITPNLNYKTTGPAKVNGYATIQMSFQNPTPTIIPNLIFTTVLKKEGKTYIKNTSNEYSVAPNTAFHVNLGLDGQRVEPGKYQLDVVARSGPFFKWHFTDNFEILPAKADKVNQNAIFPAKAGIDWWKVIAIVAIIIFIIALILLVVYWRKRNKKLDQHSPDVQLR